MSQGFTSDAVIRVTIDNISISGASVNQGSPTVLASGWPVKITDGINILGTIANPLITTVSNLLSISIPQPLTITGGVFISGNPIVTVSNLPAIQTVQGTVALSGIPSINFNTPITNPLTPTVINFNSAGQNILVAGITSETIRVFRMLLVNTFNTTITFYSGTNTALSGPMPIAGSGSMVLDFSPAPWYITTPGSGFNINSSSASQMSGTIWYTQS